MNSALSRLDVPPPLRRVTQLYMVDVLGSVKAIDTLFTQVCYGGVVAYVVLA